MSGHRNLRQFQSSFGCLLFEGSGAFVGGAGSLTRLTGNNIQFSHSSFKVAVANSSPPHQRYDSDSGDNGTEYRASPTPSVEGIGRLKGDIEKGHLP
jgi:hypothetical protein